MSEDGPGPDFDPMWNGHVSVHLDGQIHRLVSSYENGQRVDATECGLDLTDVSVHRYEPRASLEERGIDHCGDCWPDVILERDQ